MTNWGKDKSPGWRSILEFDKFVSAPRSPPPSAPMNPTQSPPIPIIPHLSPSTPPPPPFSICWIYLLYTQVERLHHPQEAFRPDLAQGRCVKFINTNELAELFLSRFQVASRLERRRLSPRPSSIPSALPPFAARILWSSEKGLSVGERRAVTLLCCVLFEFCLTTDEAMCVCVCVCVCV